MTLTVGDLASLGILEHYADGREATVYSVEGSDHLLLKQYHDPDRIDFAELNRLCERVKDFKHPYGQQAATAAWPTRVIADEGVRFAVLVPRPDQRFTVGGRPRRLTDLVEPSSRGIEDREITVPERLSLVRRLAQYVAALHRNDIVLGGIRHNRILWSLEKAPEVYFLDCDRYRIVGYRPVREQEGDERPLPRGDCRDLCLVTAQILLGRPDLTPDALASDSGHWGYFGRTVRRLLAEVADGGPWPMAVRWSEALDKDEVLARGGTK